MRGHFFPTSHLTLAQKRAICEAARDVCRAWWVDQLDCRISFARRKVEKSFDEIIAKLDERCHFSLIDRVDCLEIGFSTMREPEWFLWVTLDPSWTDRLAELGYTAADMTAR